MVSSYFRKYFVGIKHAELDHLNVGFVLLLFIREYHLPILLVKVRTDLEHLSPLRFTFRVEGPHPGDNSVCPVALLVLHHSLHELILLHSFLSNLEQILHTIIFSGSNAIINHKCNA